MEVFSSFGLCLIVLALKVPKWEAGYLCERGLTQDDAIEVLLAFLDGEFILIDLWLAVALFDLDFALGDVVVDEIILPLDFSLPLFVVVAPVNLRSTINILC